MLTSYEIVLNSLLKTLMTTKSISNVERKISTLKQCDRYTSVEYGKDLWEKTLRCGNVYMEDHVKSFFEKGLHDGMKSHVQIYWSTHTTEDLYMLDAYTTSPATLGGIRTKPHKSPNENNRSNRRHDRRNGPSSVAMLADSISRSDATFPAKVHLTNNEKALIVLNDDTAFPTTSARTNAMAPTITGRNDMYSVPYSFLHVTSICNYISDKPECFSLQSANITSMSPRGSIHR